MTERPVLFTGAMVRAILAGRKTQTRRVVKYPSAYGEYGWHPQPDGSMRFAAGGSARPVMKYGVPGDSLWVRETWYCDHYKVQRGGGFKEVEQAKELLYYRATDCDPSGACYTGFSGETMDPPWNPSIHMPRWASRISLKVTSVRIERLQEVSCADAIAEGCAAVSLHAIDCDSPDPRDEYRALWDSINGKPIIIRDEAGKEINRRWVNWAANPLVWVIGFERMS